MINVTKTFFPPQEDYHKQLERIWKNEWLTNRGELVRELEEKIKEALKLPHATLMTNGTLPLQIALKVLAREGEVITTPFSYVATTASIVWENCTPVFVDIDPEHLTIDESRIEAAITPRTTAILATHVFGNPCHVEAIEAIATRHKLKVIYDAAHCFGVNYKGKSLFHYGDVSTCSFHATKLFHTGEGGAIFCQDDELHHRLYYHHNFGHKGPVDFHGLGINAKMSELQAAMGLCVLPYMGDILASRKKTVGFYDKNLDFSNLSKIKIREETEWNYSYYPVIFESEEKLLEAQSRLNKENIFPRRYFYPSLNTVNYVKSEKMPVSEDITRRILCLPLYWGMQEQDLERIVNITNSKGARL
jgi:dTDP-4-amino-4,6-dideoxygalactose transaminase